MILIISAILGSIGVRSEPEPTRSYSEQQQDRADVVEDMELRPEYPERP
jgi:hypothetical protein